MRHPRSVDIALVLAQTETARPPLVPEISLRLVTARCSWWRSTPEAMVRDGIAEPIWAFAWAGGQALARYLLDYPGEVRGRRVLDAALNGLTLGFTARDLVGRRLRVDLVLAGDVTYDAGLTARVLRWLRALAAQGAAVLLADPEPGFLAGPGLEEAARYDAPADNDPGFSWPRETSVFRLRPVSPPSSAARSGGRRPRS